MSYGLVEFTLDDGEAMVLVNDDLRLTYEALWDLANEPGAVSTAALLMDTWRLHPLARRPVVLTILQSAVLREAVLRVHPEAE